MSDARERKKMLIFGEERRQLRGGAAIGGRPSQRLAVAAPDLEHILTRGGDTPSLFTVPEIRCETVWVTMRDGVRLTTDLYLPPIRPAPAIAVRTPYGRAVDKFVGVFLS